MAASPSSKVVALSMVCTGCICRSPTAEAVVREHLQRASLGHLFSVTSHGTHGHTGWPADRRSAAVAAARGYDLSAHRARALHAADYASLDVLLALDASHLEHMRAAAPAPAQPKLRMLTAFVRHLPAPARRAAAAAWVCADIDDPYYEDTEAFERALDGIELAAEGLVAAVQSVRRQSSEGEGLAGAPLALALLQLLDADAAAAAAR